MTRERILQVALSEFAEHGYSGGRIDRVSRAAAVNVRMIYHYFGNKEELYLAALEETYRTIRDREQTLDLDETDPVSAMRKLIELTFEFLAKDPHFVRIIMSENLTKGNMAKRSKVIPQMTRPLLNTLQGILKRGQKENIFHKLIDAENLYISILGLCFIHVSNCHTLGTMFQRDFTDPEWLEQRKALVTEILLTYLTGDGSPSNP